MFDNNRDANLYMKNSYVKWKGKPVLVISVDSRLYAKIIIIEEIRHHKVPINKLDISPFKLGYHFSERLNKAIYLERAPIRAWRVGLTAANVTSKGARSIGWEMPFKGSKQTLDFLSPTYPSLEEAYLKACHSDTEYPFHHKFSVDFEGVVRYKTKMVGKYKEEDEVIHLSSSYLWLTELLEESI